MGSMQKGRLQQALRRGWGEVPRPGEQARRAQALTRTRLDQHVAAEEATEAGKAVSPGKGGREAGPLQSPLRRSSGSDCKPRR